MSEAIIMKKTKGNFININAIFKTEYITSNQLWTMPGNIVNNRIYVWIFGGGGGGITNQNGGNGICIVQYYIRS